MNTTSAVRSTRVASETLQEATPHSTSGAGASTSTCSAKALLAPRPIARISMRGRPVVVDGEPGVFIPNASVSAALLWRVYRPP